MSKEKNGSSRNDKKAPQLNLKEKRAAKSAKKLKKSQTGKDL